MNARILLPDYPKDHPLYGCYPSSPINISTAKLTFLYEAAEQDGWTNGQTVWLTSDKKEVVTNLPKPECNSPDSAE